MLKITRSVEYGLIAVDYLAHHADKLFAARDLSQSLELPAGILAKILQRLASAGIVVSELGAHGGYRLGRPLSDVSFLELAHAIEGVYDVTPCGDETECERRPRCSVAGPVADIGARITGLLSEISLGSLLSDDGADSRRTSA